MPLPDASKHSPRVYTLLQNQDLENVTADTLADIADPIAIEEANEDELRRLCLVAFARMVTKGSFDGWLSGGGAFNAVIPDASTINSTYDINRVDSIPPWSVTTGNNSSSSRDEPQWYPFLASKSGIVTSISMDIAGVAASAVNMNVAIYSDDDGLPNAKLTEAVFDAEVDGLTTQTSLTGTATLTAGAQYWIGFVRSAGTAFTYTAGSSATAYMGPTASLTNSWTVFWYPSSSANALPATVTKTTLEPRGNARLSVGVEF